MTKYLNIRENSMKKHISLREKYIPLNNIELFIVIIFGIIPFFYVGMTTDDGGLFLIVMVIGVPFTIWLAKFLADKTWDAIYQPRIDARKRRWENFCKNNAKIPTVQLWHKVLLFPESFFLAILSFR